MPILSLAVAAAVQSNDAEIRAAQARFRATIERSVVEGIRSVTGPNDLPCETRFAGLSPGVQPAAALAQGLRIDWRRAKSVYFVPGKPGARAWWTNYVEVSSGSGTWPLHPAPDQVGPMMTAANALMRLCANAPASAVTAPPASPVAAIGERYMVDPDVLKTPQCRFRQIPELLLTDNQKPVVKRMIYRVSARGGEGDRNYFAVSGQAGKQDYNPKDFSNWRGVLAEPGFWIQSEQNRARQVKSASLLADGRATGIPLYVGHERSWDGKGYSPFVKVAGQYYMYGEQIIKKLDGASTATVRLYDASGGLVSEWNYDVRTLHRVPDALAAAKWTCR